MSAETTPEPPPMLSGNDGENYFLVSEFSEAEIHRAAREALEEWHLVTEEIPEEAVKRLAKEGSACRMREHTEANGSECDCGGEGASGWWCDFGKGEVEGLYVGFEFAVGERIYLEVLSEQA